MKRCVLFFFFLCNAMQHTLFLLPQAKTPLLKFTVRSVFALAFAPNTAKLARAKARPKRSFPLIYFEGFRAAKPIKI